MKSVLLAMPEFTPFALLDAVKALGIEIELIERDVPMPTVPAAAAAIGVEEGQILKTLLFVDRNGTLARVIASGPDRIDRKALATIAELDRPTLASPELVLEATGWPAGGVAPVGSRRELPTYIDEQVMRWDYVYGGGGTEETLIRMRPDDIVRLNGATIAKLTQASS